MADTHGEQPIRTLDPGDVLVSITDPNSPFAQIDPRDTRALTNADIVTAVAAADGSLNATVTGTVTAAQVTAANLNATVTGSTVTVTNPTTPGDLKAEVSGQVLTDILNALGGGGGATAVYGTASLAAGANDSGANTTHTVTAAKIAVINSVICASTAAARYEVQVDSAVKYIGFTSESSPAIVIDCGGLEVAATKVIKVVMKNLDNQTLSLYSSINYYEK